MPFPSNPSNGEVYVDGNITLVYQDGVWTSTGGGANFAPGASGATGATGITGSTGPEGPRGSDGPAGAKGDPGDPGPASVQGATGATGVTNYTAPGPGGATRAISDRLGDYVSVKDYGATGDGVTDDTTAISNAIATGKQVLFPEGEYVMSSSITIDRLDIVGHNATVIGYNGLGFLVSKSVDIEGKNYI